jgi:hypothetical protein
MTDILLFMDLTDKPTFLHTFESDEMDMKKIAGEFAKAVSVFYDL